MTEKAFKIGVLLIHGLTGTPTEMSRVERYFKKRDMEVEVPLLAGHGVSTSELLDSTWQQWVESVRPSLKRLSETCDHIFCAGMCMGALICILLAQEDPKIQGLILMSPDCGIPAPNASKLSMLLPLGLVLPRFLQKKIYWVEKPPYGVRDQRIQDEITYSIEQSKKRESQDFGTFRTYLVSFKETALLRSRAYEVLKTLQTPTLILQSREDTLMDPSNAEVMFGKLSTPRRSIYYLTGCDHVMTIDLKHREVCEKVDEFIIQEVSRAA